MTLQARVAADVLGVVHPARRNLTFSRALDVSSFWGMVFLFFCEEEKKGKKEKSGRGKKEKTHLSFDLEKNKNLFLQSLTASSLEAYCCGWTESDLDRELARAHAREREGEESVCFFVFFFFSATLERERERERNLT